MLGKRVVDFTITGKGLPHIYKYDQLYLDTLVTDSKTLTNGILGVTVDELKIEPLVVGSWTERLFFIKNLTKNREIQYKWKT